MNSLLKIKGDDQYQEELCLERNKAVQFMSREYKPAASELSTTYVPQTVLVCRMCFCIRARVLWQLLLCLCLCSPMLFVQVSTFSCLLITWQNFNLVFKWPGCMSESSMCSMRSMPCGVDWHKAENVLYDFVSFYTQPAPFDTLYLLVIAFAF